ncbi:unannotated protein [freshwater metagenome]|uniref:Unannotated protein n=1 Tax=freshwater metagenome TaxID=449393 RepID=A0A6J6UBD9_9ZZZZ
MLLGSCSTRILPKSAPGAESTAMNAARVWRLWGANVVVREKAGSIWPGIWSVR